MSITRSSSLGDAWRWQSLINVLTPRQRGGNLQTFSDSFSCMANFIFSFKFHESVLPRVSITIYQPYTDELVGRLSGLGLIDHMCFILCDVTMAPQELSSSNNINSDTKHDTILYNMIVINHQLNAYLNHAGGCHKKSNFDVIRCNHQYLNELQRYLSVGNTTYFVVTNQFIGDSRDGWH